MFSRRELGASLEERKKQALEELQSIFIMSGISVPFALLFDVVVTMAVASFPAGDASAQCFSDKNCTSPSRYRSVNCSEGGESSREIALECDRLSGEVYGEYFLFYGAIIGASTVGLILLATLCFSALMGVRYCMVSREAHQVSGGGSELENPTEAPPCATSPLLG